MNRVYFLEFLPNRFHCVSQRFDSVWLHNLWRCLVPKEKRPHQSLLMLILLFVPVLLFLVSDWFYPAKIESQYSLKEQWILKILIIFFCFLVGQWVFLWRSAKVGKFNRSMSWSRSNICNWIMSCFCKVLDTIFDLNASKFKACWYCGFIIRTRFDQIQCIILDYLPSFFYGLGVYLVFAMLPINYSFSLGFSAVYESFTCNVNCVILMQFVIRMPMPNYDLNYLQWAVYLIYF